MQLMEKSKYFTARHQVRIPKNLLWFLDINIQSVNSMKYTLRAIRGSNNLTQDVISESHTFQLSEISSHTYQILWLKNPMWLSKSFCWEYLV